MKSIFRSTSSILLLSVLFLASCVPYKTMYKQSVTLYNQAVTTETKFRLDQVKKSVTNFNDSPAKKDFKVAYDTINSFISQYKDKLATDNLYGNALALKAMCEYGLEMNNVAPSTAEQALTYLKSSTSSDKSRDLAMMTAMPGLIMGNQLYDKLPADDKTLGTVEYKGLADMATSASESLKKGQEELKGEPKSKMNQYLVMSELAVYKNWLDAVFNTVDKTSTDAAVAQKRQREDDILKLAKGAIGKLSDPIVAKQWKTLIGI